MVGLGVHLSLSARYAFPGEVFRISQAREVGLWKQNNQIAVISVTSNSGCFILSKEDKTVKYIHYNINLICHVNVKEHLFELACYTSYPLLKIGRHISYQKL